MALGAASAVDPYVLQKFFPTFGNVARYNSYPSRAQIRPGSYAGTTKGLLIIGDSTPSNTVPTAYTVTQGGNMTLNPCNGGLYLSADPMLGASNGTGSPFIASFATRLGDLLISGAHTTNVIMCNVGYGSTKIGDWSVRDVSGASGTFNQDIGVAYQRFVRNGLTVDGVVWLGGPNDVAAGTSQATYTAQLNSMISTVRGFLPSTPIIINFYSDNSAPNAGIIAAQNAVINHSSQIWEGVNLDAYTADKFQPGHLSDLGSSTFATDLVAKLVTAGVVT